MKLIYLTILYDFYGDLLTDKQRELFEAYYHDNLSLREMGDIYGISPQAARDHLLRAEKLLENYEEKLKLYKNEERRKKIIDEILKELEEIKGEQGIKLRQKVEGLL